MSKNSTIIRNIEWNIEDSGVVFINFMLLKPTWFNFKPKLLFAGSLAIIIRDNNYLDIMNSLLMDTTGVALPQQDIYYKCSLLLLAANFEEACWEDEHADILRKSVLNFGKNG